MVGLGWILAIIIGALAGWLAGKIMHSTHGLLMDIVLGIVGAIIGNQVTASTMTMKRTRPRRSRTRCSVRRKNGPPATSENSVIPV